MFYTYPKLLWALCLLVIPILIHLFIRRKFKKMDFSYIGFLQKSILHSRKGSKLKEILILTTRILGLFCLIMAFAKPYLSSEKKSVQNKEIVVYIDNSFSMQAPSKSGKSHLEFCIQDLLKHYAMDTEITVFTNTQVYPNTYLKSIAKTLQNTTYQPTQKTLKQIILQGKSLFKDPKKGALIIYSDFFDSPNSLPISKQEDFAVYYIANNSTKKTNNIALDTVYIDTKEKNTLVIKTSSTHITKEKVGLSLSVNGSKKAKTLLDFSKTTQLTTRIASPTQSIYSAKLELSDDALSYDNQLFFNTIKANTPSILCITGKGVSDTFFKKLYAKKEFTTEFKTMQNNMSSWIKDQNLVILNGISYLNTKQIKALKNHAKNNGSIIYIPAMEQEKEITFDFYRHFGLGSIQKKIQQELPINTIAYQDPILKQVFYKHTDDFLAPKVSCFYRTENRATPLLSLGSKDVFLSRDKNIYACYSALQEKYTDFTKHPLFVATFYAIAQHSIHQADLYYTIGQKNDIAMIPNTSSTEQYPIELRYGKNRHMALQKQYQNNIALQSFTYPKIAATYALTHKQDTLKKVSYNYARNQKIAMQNQLDFIVKNQTYSSIKKIKDLTKNSFNIQELWKWFLIFALAFFLVEMLILKFFR